MKTHSPICENFDMQSKIAAIETKVTTIIMATTIITMVVVIMVREIVLVD